MKRLVLFFCLIGLLVSPALAQNAPAQDAVRLVVLPFNADTESDAYALGLAAALQRGLNVVNNVYAPPVGDAILLTQRLTAEGNLSAESVADAYSARATISGEVVSDGGTATVTLGFTGPEIAGVASRTITAPLGDPAALVLAALNATVSQLELPIGSRDRAELNAVAAATPSLESLAAAAEGALRLPDTPEGALAAAAQQDPGSSWVQAEHARALALVGDFGAALAAAERAVTATPEDVEAHVVRGIVLLAAGEAAAATQAFDAALAINGAHPLALAGKAQLSANPAEATQLLERALAVYPRLVEGYVALARLQAADNLPRALNTIRRGAQLVPESLVLHRTLLEIALQGGDAAGALAYLRDTVLARPGAAANLYGLATFLPDAYLAEATALVRQGRERYPAAQSLLLAEVDLLARQGDAGAAETLLAAALSERPGDTRLANELAVVQARQGKLEEARATLESVSAGDPTAQFNLAQLYLQAGQAAAALTAIEPVVAANPNDAAAQNVYGLALARVGRYQEARAALERALALDPSLQSAQNALALLEQEQELTGGQAVQLSAEAASAFERGRDAFERGDYTAAAVAFAESRQYQEEGVTAFFHGLSLYFGGQVRAAATAFEAAVAALPESDIVLNNLGLVQLQLGRYDLALPNLERAVSLNAENANAHLNLGLANYQLGRYGAAVSAWEQATALEPSLESAVAERLADARRRASP